MAAKIAASKRLQALTPRSPANCICAAASSEISAVTALTKTAAWNAWLVAHLASSTVRTDGHQNLRLVLALVVFGLFMAVLFLLSIGPAHEPPASRVCAM